MRSPHKQGQYLINLDFSGSLAQALDKEHEARKAGRHKFRYSMARDDRSQTWDGDPDTWCERCAGYYGVPHDHGKHGIHRPGTCACMICQVTFMWERVRRAGHALNEQR